MKIITGQDVLNLKISPLDAFEWVREVFCRKRLSNLPPKISMKSDDHRFYNTMPCELPYMNVFGVKEVNRYPGRKPSLDSKMLLYDLKTGKCKALLDANEITAMRTGAVAALAVEIFAVSGYETLGVVGLGEMAHSTMRVLLARRRLNHLGKLIVNLYRYKDQAEKFAEEFTGDDLEYRLFDSMEELIRNSQVVLSCVTYVDGTFAPDSAFQHGCTIIPVHTRGFQNCDLFFDKIYADDEGHVSGFQYFKQFRYFAELGDVINRTAEGRKNDLERILSYNIGIAAHDVYFAQKIFERCDGALEIEMT